MEFSGKSLGGACIYDSETIKARGKQCMQIHLNGGMWEGGAETWEAERGREASRAGTRGHTGQRGPRGTERGQVAPCGGAA